MASHAISISARPWQSPPGTMSMRRSRAMIAAAVPDAPCARDLVACRPEIDLGWITPRRPIRIAFEEAGGADRGLPWIGGKIAGEESVIRKVTVVVAGVERPTAGVAVTQRTRSIIITRKNRRNEDKRRQHGKRRFFRMPCDRRKWFSHGRIVPQSPFHPVSRPLRN